MQVLERGERIELLVQSTDNLQTQAFSFKRDAGRLQRSMWWKNVRAQVMLVFSQPTLRTNNGCLHCSGDVSVISHVCGKLILTPRR